MKLKKILAGAVAGAALLGTVAIASPAGASTPKPSIVEIVASSANDNAPGKATDRNWNDFDILFAAVQALGLADDVTSLQGATVFAPADASFRGLVADLTNTPIWRLSEQQVLDTLVAIAGTPDLNNTGISGAAALTETVLYHVTGENITNLPRRAFGKNITSVNTFGVPALLTNQIDPFNFFGFVGLQDGDKNDLDPFYVGRTVPASNGTVHVIAGVLRPLDLKVLFPAD